MAKKSKIVAGLEDAVAHARGDVSRVKESYVSPGMMMAILFQFENGDCVKDIITGFKGYIVNRTEWINGCRRYTVESEEMKDGLPAGGAVFDEAQLVIAGKPLKLPRRAEPSGGGGRADPQRSRDPAR